MRTRVMMSMLGLMGCGAPVEVEVVPVAAPAAPSVVVAHAEPLAPSEEEAPVLVDGEALPSAPATHGRTVIDGEWADQAEPPPPPSAAPAPPTTFSSFAGWDLALEPSLPEVCARIVQQMGRTQAGAHCRDLGALPFASGPTVRGLRRIQIVESGYAFQQLVARVAGGWVALPITWSAQNHPRDPGCPSIVRLRGLEQARMEGERLLVIGVGETTEYDGDGYPLHAVLRQPFVVDFVTMRAAEYSPLNGVNVGRKTLPRGVSGLGRGTPWRGRLPVTVNAAGALMVVSR